MQSMKKIKRFAIPVLVITGIMVFIAYTLSNNTQTASDEIKAEKQTVKFVVNATYSKIIETISETPIRGQLEPRNIFTLFSETDGKVIYSALAIGKLVKKGEKILVVDASLRNTNQSILEQGLRKVHLDYEVAQKNFNRFKNLLKNGNASTIDYENAKAQLDATEMQLRTAEQQLEATKIQLKQTSVLAPANGIVIEKKVNKGDYVQPGSTVGILAENVLIVKCFVPENIALASSPGEEVRLKADALPNQTWSGTIHTIVPYPNEAKLYPIEIYLKNHQSLIAGLGVQIIFSKAKHEKTLLIPRTALTGDFKNPSVYIIDKHKNPIKRSVTMGKTIGSNIEILSGLKEQELVIVNGHHNIEPGKILADFKIVK